MIFQLIVLSNPKGFDLFIIKMYFLTEGIINYAQIFENNFQKILHNQSIFYLC